MNRSALLLAVAVLAPGLAFAQTPPAAAPAAPQAAPAAQAVPLPTWFREIDPAKKGEVTREEFVKYRMKTFEQLDANKDNKLSVDELVKVAEPPFVGDTQGLPPPEERRARAREQFRQLDTNGDNFVDRGEAEALVHAEFNLFDANRDNKASEAEVRLVVQRQLREQDAIRQQQEQRRRQGMMTLAEFIDMQLRGADQLDKNGDGRVSQQEYLAMAGPPDGPQTQQQGLPPFEFRRQLAIGKFQEIDANKDGMLDRTELTAYGAKLFGEMDLNKDRFLDEEEFKKAQEAESTRVRERFTRFQQQQQPPRPAPAPAGQQRPPQPAPQPTGPAPGLPQQMR